MKRFAKQKRKAEKALADSIYRSTFHTLETYAVPDSLNTNGSYHGRMNRILTN